MVATRRSSGKFIDVELSDNGKELQEVIPIEEQRAAIARASQESEEDEIQETSPVLVEPPPPTKKKETRGRKRKNPNANSTSSDSSASSSSASSSSSSSSSFDPVKKIERRGRKRKNPDVSVPTTIKRTSVQNNLLRPTDQQTPTDTSIATNIVPNKHKINHLLTDDAPLHPPPQVQNSISSATLPSNSLKYSTANPQSIPNVMQLPITTPQRPVLPTPALSTKTAAALQFLSQANPLSAKWPAPIANDAPRASKKSTAAATTTSASKPSETRTTRKGLSSGNSNGRIPITSIISQKIDLQDIPLMLDDGSGTENGDKKTKRRYRVDRDNIKINKRIMSQDTEDVIKMFKKFDDEVLTNPEARSRLLSLGFETRKRYITTFKHYIRFCCKKKLDKFFVTGELMKEFYQEQFAMSSSNKPVIRLRKMDPAFSKLQEINFLVYHLANKDIPNRHLALEYLVYKEMGQDPPTNGSSDGKINTLNESAPVAAPAPAPAPGSLPGSVPVSKTGPIAGPESVPIPTPALVLPTIENLDSGQRPSTRSSSNKKTAEQKEQELTPLTRNSANKRGRKSLKLKLNLQLSTSGTDMGETSLSDSNALKMINMQSRYVPPLPQQQQQQPQQPPQKVLSQRALPPTHSLVSSSVPSSITTSNDNKSGDSTPVYTKKVTKKNIEAIRKSFSKMRQDIQEALHRDVSVDPAFVSKLADNINASLDDFELQLNGPSPPPPQMNSNGIPIIDLNNKIYTVYDILEEWYKIEPSIATRLEKWGEGWIRDSIDHNTFLERKLVVEFVERMSKECNVDIYVIANDCDRYIRDKSILEEFIAELDLDVDDLFKRILRYRQRRG